MNAEYTQTKINQDEYLHYLLINKLFMHITHYRATYWSRARKKLIGTEKLVGVLRRTKQSGLVLTNKKVPG